MSVPTGICKTINKLTLVLTSPEVESLYFNNPMVKKSLPNLVPFVEAFLASG